MASPSRDLKWLIVDVLISDAGITGMVADRVATEHEVPGENDLKTSEMPKIVIESISGNTRMHGAVQDVILHFYAYSRTSLNDAGDLYDKIHTLMHQTRLAELTGVVKVRGVIRETERPDEGYNSDMNAYFYRGIWRFIGTTGQATQ